MGRKKKYKTEEDKVNAQKRWNMEYYEKNKKEIQDKNLKRYYDKKNRK